MKRGPNSVDVNVGARVRNRRLAIGLTQDKLAKAVGITFQQIQKYEKGVNRIGAGRLQDISRVLGAPVAHFYSDLPDTLNDRLREARVKKAPEASDARKTPNNSDEALRLVKSFLKLKDPDARRHLVGIAESLAKRTER